MKHSKPFCLSVVASVLTLATTVAAHAAVETPNHPNGFVPGELLVGLRPSVTSVLSVNNVASSVGDVAGIEPVLRVARVKVHPGVSLENAMAQLRRRSDVLYVERNGIYKTQATPNDASFFSQYAPQKVQATLAWDIWRPKAQVIVAVVDTGIDYTHPDLTNKVLRNGATVVGYNALGTNARTGVGSDPIDDQGHGTHCAGIAAAQIDNGVGVAGIAGWNGAAGTTDVSTKLMPVKVLDSTGGGSDASVAAGIRWAADNGAKVISLSIGGGGSTTLQSAVTYATGKGCVLVVAAGNSSTSSMSYPAGYSTSNSAVISVAATDSTDRLASYSNYGSWVSVAAPGSSIYSTLPVVSTGGGFGTNYGTLSGTSMATPLVSGEAALLLAQNPALTAAQVKSLIIGNVDPYTPYYGSIAPGSGRVNVYRALQAVGGGTPTAPAAPTGLKAVGGNAQVSLSWTGSAGATSYYVKRSTVSGSGYVTIATPTGTTYTDPNVVNGTTYYYVVRAVNSVGQSANSAQVSATPQVVVTQQLLGNTGFENGSASPAPWVVSAGVIDSSTGEAAHSGSWKAWLCGYGTTHTDSVYQQVTVPSTASSATLSFWLHIDTAESTPTVAYDTLRVQVRNASGAVLATLDTYSNLHRNAGYTFKSYDLSAYRGQTIQIALVGSEDYANQTSFVLDDFALTVK